MTNTQHTPGPWRIKGTNSGYTNRHVLGPKHADGGDYAPICVADTEANARLIAAAPELLKALKGARLDLYARQAERESLGLPKSFPALDASIAEIEAAIAKATGQQLATAA